MKPRCDVDVSSQCCSCCLRAGWTCICIYLYTHTCVLHVCINISYIHTFVDCYSTCLYTFDTNHTCVYIYYRCSLCCCSCCSLHDVYLVCFSPHGSSLMAARSTLCSWGFPCRLLHCQHHCPSCAMLKCFSIRLGHAEVKK